MTTYLVVKATDEAGTDLAITGARLVDGAGHLAVSLGVDKTLGMSADVTSAAEGEYQLRLDLDHHPVMPFNGQLKDDSGGERIFSFIRPSPKCCTVARKHAVKDDAKSPVVVTLHFELSAKHEALILVAGWDYSGGADNTLYAKTLRDDLYRGKTNFVESPTRVLKDQATGLRIHDYTIVTLFDFKSGQRIRWVKGQSRWHEIDSQLQGTVATHTGQYSTPANQAKRHGDDSISIVHVYDDIIDLGGTAPGSVMGLHLFSHAWDGGPILVNTNQDPRYGHGGPDAALRDPGDKDGRTKDFTLENMPAVASFKAAFRGDAHIKVWGCLAARAYRKLARAAAKARKAGRPRAEKLSLVVEGTAVSLSQEEIEDLFKTRIIAGTYMQKLAAAIGLTVFGAPPGAGSNLARVGQRHYMYVDQSIYDIILDWYDAALGLKHDETGHIPYT